MTAIVLACLTFFPPTGLIAMTAVDDPDARLQAQAAGFDDCLVEPV